MKSHSSSRKISLRIEPSTPLVFSFDVRIETSATILELLQKIAKKLNVPYEYIVLYKTLPARSDRNNGTNYRTDNFRIDYQPSREILDEIKVAMKEMAEINVKNSKEEKEDCKEGTIRIENRIRFQNKQLELLEQDQLKWQKQTLLDVGINKSQTLQLALRVLRGDHIHLVFGIFVDQDFKGPKPLSYFLDRPSTEFIYEAQHLEQQFEHVGLHAGKQQNWFNLSLVHAHPGTSKAYFHQSEGFGANIDLFFEQISIWIWEKNSIRYPSHGPLSNIIEPKHSVFDFPINAQFRDGRTLVSKLSATTQEAANNPDDENNVAGAPLSICKKHEKEIDEKKEKLAGCGGMSKHSSEDISSLPSQQNSWNGAEYGKNRILIENSDTHVWRMYYYEFFTQNEPSFVTEENFGRLWLNNNLGSVIFSYERRDNKKQPDRTLILNRYLYMSNIVIDSRPRLWQPYLDETDITEHKGELVPYNVSGLLTVGFDGSYYPMTNYKQRNLSDWRKSWIWPFIKECPISRRTQKLAADL